MKPLSKQFLIKRGYCCFNGCKNCPYNMKFKIGNSRIEGKGLIAKEIIAKGQIIGKAYDIIGKTPQGYIIGNSHTLGTYHNHSLQPNATPIIKRNDIVFSALYDIQPEEEITINYNAYTILNILNLEKPTW